MAWDKRGNKQLEEGNRTVAVQDGGWKRADA